MKTDDLAPPVEDVTLTEELAPVEDVDIDLDSDEADEADPAMRQDALQWEAQRLMEFKKNNVKRGNQTSCPACATYVQIKANKCPHCSSDIAANNALVRESMRRLEEVTAELETMREQHMERFQNAPRPPFSERFRSFFVDPHTRQDMKIVVPSFLALFGLMAVFRMLDNQILFWSFTAAGFAGIYALFNRLAIKRLITIDLYRFVLIFGLVSVMAGVLSEPSTWWPEPNSGQVQVLASTVNIRASNTTQSTVLATAHRGEKLDIVEKRNSWYKIETSDGQEGWVYASLVR